MTETMKEWQQHKRGGPAYDASGASGSEANIAIPLSQGEWDEPIGVPLCVVCHNVCIEVRLRKRLATEF